MSNVSVCESCDDGKACFISDDGSFFMRRDEEWWAIDCVDDRGRRHNDTARFSTFELAENYLIWRWGSTMRSALGTGSLGPDLYSRGYSADVQVLPTRNEWQFEVQADTGCAILPEPSSTIFSHLILMSADDIERAVRRGIA